MTMPSQIEIEAETVPWRALFGRDHLGALLMVCLGVWLHAADSLVVATMMPAIVADIGGERLVAWNFALYEVGAIVVGASSGLLAMRLGVGRPMTLAALVFAAGCVASTVAPDMATMLAGRVAQGLGGGGLVSLAFVGAARLFPPAMIPRIMAAMSILWGASAFVGPLIGGLFVAWGSWRAGFALFAAKAVLLALWLQFGPARHTPKGTGPVTQMRIPGLRLALLSLAIVAVSYAGITHTTLGLTLALAVGLGSLAVFSLIDGRSGDGRLLPQSAFDPRAPIGAGLVMVLAVSMAAMGLTAFGPLLMAIIHQTPALTAGYVVALISIAWTVGAVLTSGMPERHDPAVIALGMFLVAVSLAGYVVAVARGPVGLIALCAAGEGLGFGMAWTFILRRAGRLVRDDDAERLAAALPTVSQIGYALGAAVVGILANSAGFGPDPTPQTAVRVAHWVFAGSLPFALLALVAMLRFVTARA